MCNNTERPAGDEASCVPHGCSEQKRAQRRDSQSLWTQSHALRLRATLDLVRTGPGSGLSAPNPLVFTHPLLGFYRDAWRAEVTHQGVLGVPAQSGSRVPGYSPAQASEQRQ